jgi:hypothetical protein
VLGLSAKHVMYCAQVVKVFAAIAAITWSAVTMASFMSEAPFVAAAQHIIAGEHYQQKVMQDFHLRNENNESEKFRPSMISSAVVVELRNVEDAMAVADHNNIGSDLTLLDRMVGNALTASPSNSYQWLVRFWVTNTRTGFDKKNLRYLRLSYETGPREGWIAVRRNRLALAIFPTLTPELQQSALSEFADLVRSRLYGEAAEILAGPGWPIRNVLYQSLASLPVDVRRSFGKIIIDRHIDEAPPLGAEPRPIRPWS